MNRVKCGAKAWHKMPKSVKMHMLERIQERLGFDPEISYKEIRSSAKSLSDSQWSELDPEVKRIFCKFSRQYKF